MTVAGMTITRGLAGAKSPIIGSIGGGVLNYGSLTLSNDAVSYDRALGDASASPFGFPGFSVAGGIANFGTLDVTTSQFTGNLAQGWRPLQRRTSGRRGWQRDREFCVRHNHP